MKAKKKLIDLSVKSKEKIAELHKKQADLENAIVAAKKEESQIQWELAKTEAESLVAKIDDFAELFSSGVVREKFNAIQEILSNLAQYDPNYINALGSGNPYGSIKGTPQIQYVVGYLLGGVWKKETDLWSVLSQIADTKHMEGNYFNG